MEGIHDVVFLQGISAVLREADPGLPDLAALESEGRLIFIPFGGSDPAAWATRFAPLGLPELHLYDREFEPDMQARRAAARIVNARPRCRAFVTRRPTLECYLHPDAIWRSTGIRVVLDEGVDVVEAVARARFARSRPAADWPSLSVRSRKRFRDRMKRQLNTAAVRRMTPELLAQHDPQDEVIGWFRAVEELLGGL